MKNIKKKLFLINEFINNSRNFWNDHKIKNLDSKHKKILKQFSIKYKKNTKLFSDEIIDWEGQTNLGAPFQFSYEKIKNSTFKQNLKNFKNIFIQNYFNKVSFFDDLEIIKKNKGMALIENLPVHLSLSSTDTYFIKKNVSTNNRWNRYAYISSQIKNFKLLDKNNSDWLDIGSYYGGLQLMLKKYFRSQNFYLIDFHHQLCRSYVLLKDAYPDANHILPNQLITNKKYKNSFFYVPVQKLNIITNKKFDLITNFFSFGEMTRPFFNYYFQNKLINNAKVLYLVNRFISSPNFEPTYNNDLNIFDYEKKNFNTKYFDIFPIHHYKNIKRKIFNRASYRPISSPYFEKIMINKNFKK